MKYIGFSPPNSFKFCKKTRSGFTLIEVIISLFLITLILGLLYGVLDMTSKITRESLHVGSFEDHLRIFYNLLEEDLVSAYPKEFKGDSKTLTFYTTHLSQYGTRKVKYIFNKKKGVVYSFSENLFDEVKQEVLLKNINTFRLSYLYDKEDEKWKDSWDSEKEKRLPSMVKIVINGDKEGIIIPIFSMWKAPSFKEENEKR